MTKNIFLAAAMMLPFSVWAGVDGEWQCNVRVMSTARANGQVSKGIDYSSGTHHLAPDGSYASTSPVTPITAHGRYVLKGRKITFTPDYRDLIAVAEHTCTQAGMTCRVTAISGHETATLNKAMTTMKGKGRLQMTTLVNGSVVVRSVGLSTSTCNHR